MNITIDDMSPQIQYKGAWSNDFRSDPTIANYHAGTFHATNTDGDSVSFTFNGTDVYIYGDNKKDRGVYSVAIDGQTSGGLLNAQTTTDAYQVILFQAHNLSPTKEHTVTLTSKINFTSPPPSNTTNVYLVIDHIVVTIPGGDDLKTTAYDDFDPVFAYQDMDPVNHDPQWKYYDNTVHISYKAGASMKLDFEGCAVQLLAGTNSDHGSYMIQLDGGRSQIFDGRQPFLSANNSLFFASGLPEGPHTITLTNVGKDGTDGLDFDSAVVYSMGSPASISSSSSASPSATSSVSPPAVSQASGGNPHLDQGPNTENSSTALNNGNGDNDDSKDNLAPIIGGVAGGLLFLAVAFALALWLYRRRKTQGQFDEKSRTRVDLNDDDSGRGRAVNPFVYSVTGTRGGSDIDDSDAPRGYLPTHFQTASASSFGHSPYQEEVTPNPVRVDERGSYFTTAIPPPPSSHSSYPRTEDGRGTDRGYTYRPATPPSLLPYSSADAYSGLSPSIRRDSGPKSPAGSLLVPYTAVPPTTTRASTHDRLTLHNHEDDPISPISDERHGRLPPNYQQATQPIPGQSADRV